jgi:hypothetical protein
MARTPIGIRKAGVITALLRIAPEIFSASTGV